MNIIIFSFFIFFYQNLLNSVQAANPFSAAIYEKPTHPNPRCNTPPSDLRTGRHQNFREDNDEHTFYKYLQDENKCEDFLSQEMPETYGFNTYIECRLNCMSYIGIIDNEIHDA
ncbi:uncharacterized protein LOC106650466 [Trichogramma pretiosum]|uniref:uncharacterized protein LOC106650466 n=1 Tax=Trichogramma pretiosum TaxID=7493 RepID=UPI0006C96997|nr:uncharacterized protein LOC106650466 [Trichogramma pretiosum]